jgi:hypothetical protein
LIPIAWGEAGTADFNVALGQLLAVVPQPEHSRAGAKLEVETVVRR